MTNLLQVALTEADLLLTGERIVSRSRWVDALLDVRLAAVVEGREPAVTAVDQALTNTGGADAVLVAHAAGLLAEVRDAATKAGDA